MANRRTGSKTIPATDDLQQRRGAVRMSAIPPEVLRGLNAGELQTVNLVEWLAVDHLALMHATFADLKLAKLAGTMAAAVEPFLERGINERTVEFGKAHFRCLGQRADWPKVYGRLASHRSDTVRTWAAYALAGNERLDLEERLAKTLPFAADKHFGVRECAWAALRPFVANELDRALKLLEPLVVDADENIRRFAIELTRPRGVWCAHISTLKEKPELAASLLEPVRSDPAKYVRLSVGNWLNDASKTRPEWVEALCKRWLKQSATAETKAIVDRGLRTLRKSTIG